MMMNTVVRTLLGLAFSLSLSSIAGAKLAAGFDAALASAERPAEESERDAARKPREVLEFVGIEAGMTVLEVAAGAGWYTEVMSAAVGPEGTVYAQSAARFAERFRESATARAARLGNVEIWNHELDDLGLSDEFDVAFTAINLHDSANRDGDEGGLVFLGGIYKALKPGGVLGFIDHVGLDGQDNLALHRIEVARAKDLLLRAGFVIEAESDLLANPADDHTKRHREESLARNTDRMLIRARKPE